MMKKLFNSLNNEWTNNIDSSFDIKKEEHEITQLKSFIQYDISSELSIQREFGKKQQTCNSKLECEKKITNHKELFLNNDDAEFKDLFIKQAQLITPKLKNNWTVLKRNESYHCDCDVCNALGDVDCDTCNTNGRPTGKIRCRSCSGSCKTSCMMCFGSGKSGKGSCFGCGGSGKTTCSGCSGSGKQTCTSCSGRLRITCKECKGHKHFTFTHELSLNANYQNKISWDKNNTKKWINDYLEVEKK
jgi:hypothetical protein